MAKKKTKMGRPPIKKSDRRTSLVTLRLRPSDRKALLAEAESRGLSISSYLLECWKKARD